MLVYYVSFGIGIVILSLTKLFIYYRSTTDLYRYRKAREEQLVKYIEWIFCRKGYELIEVRHAANSELEVLLQKNSVVTMVQIWQRRGKVNKTMVEFFYNTAMKDDCDWAIIISAAGFTREAKKVARNIGISLYSRSRLRRDLKGCRLKFTE